MNEIIKSTQGQYSRRIGTDRPGLILILLDQSLSMEDNDKAKNAALAVNRVIYEIVKSSQSGTEIKDRCFVGVIGYGATVTPIVGGMIAKVASEYLGVEHLIQKISDGAGGLVEIEIEQPYWVLPTHENGTPMTEALAKAYQIAYDWTLKNQESFPPVVINITDGEPNDEVSAKKAAKKLMEIETRDGNLLLFNAHISGLPGASVILPSSNSQLSNSYAKLLFEMSSVIPDSLINTAKESGLPAETNGRGFIFNADTDNLIKLLTFGSSQFSAKR